MKKSAAQLDREIASAPLPKIEMSASDRRNLNAAIADFAEMWKSELRAPRRPQRSDHPVQQRPAVASVEIPHEHVPTTKSYEKNSRGRAGDEVCMRCGQYMPTPKRFVLTTQGMFPIGSDCEKILLKSRALRPENLADA